MAEVRVAGLSIELGGRPVLTGLDLTVDDGSICAIVGESGSGKSTLLRSIAGFTEPDGGSIHLGGLDVAGVSPQDRTATLLFQEPRLFPALNVADNVSFGLRVRGVGADERNSRAQQLLENVGLADRSRDSVKGLSGGEAQRVALARALCVRPEVLLLDEPFSAVDAPRRLELRTVIADLQAEHHTTMIFVTHDISDAVALADTVAVLADGVIVEHGPVGDVIS